jgi:hypothetical protein
MPPTILDRHDGVLPAAPVQPSGLHPLGTSLGAGIGTVFGAAIAGTLVPTLVAIGCGAAIGVALGGWCGRGVSVFFDIELSEKDWQQAMQRTMAMTDPSHPDAASMPMDRSPDLDGPPRTDALEHGDVPDASRLEWDNARYAAKVAWGHVTLR